jgi:PadR family transcriptional regulator, regulatory protein PadR
MTRRATSDPQPVSDPPSDATTYSRARQARSTTPGDKPAPVRRADEPSETADGGTEQTDQRDASPNWPPRDFLAPFVLLAVSLQRSHGYVIEDYLRALGLFGITMSTLYRTLRQMEKDGYLESTWEPGPTGPARRVYTITDAGNVWLDASAAMLGAYRETIDRFFGLYGAGLGANQHQPDGTTDEKEAPK